LARKANGTNDLTPDNGKLFPIQANVLKKVDILEAAIISEKPTIYSVRSLTQKRPTSLQRFKISVEVKTTGKPTSEQRRSTS